MKHNHRGNYKKLAKWFESNGYRVTKNKYRKENYFGIHFEEYTEWHIQGNGIEGMFCTPNRVSYPHLSGFLCIDNERCFDKWSRCAVCLKIETLNYNVLHSQLDLISSERGFEMSNSFTETDEFVYEYKRQ